MDTNRDDHQVQPEYACPFCGERDTDCLAWQPDEAIECLTCRGIYSLDDRN